MTGPRFESIRAFPRRRRFRRFGNGSIWPAWLLGILFGLSIAGSAEGQTDRRVVAPTREYHLGEANMLEITVNIWGEVGQPGSYRVPDDTDLVELISLAGGPTDFADLGEIKITRPSVPGEGRLKIDLGDYLEGRANGPPVTLLPGDTVRVPKNGKHFWRSAVQTISDVAVIVTLYVLIRDRDYYR